MRVATQARGDNVEDFIVGIKVDAGEGSPIIEQVRDRSRRINGTEFTRGDYAIDVQWLHRYTGDGHRLTFVEDKYSGDESYDVVSSTELRAVGFQLQQV